MNGSLTRLLDHDTTQRKKIVEFVGKGDFSLASGQKPDGTYERVWFQEPISPDEVAFESGVFLLTKAKVQALKAGVPAPAPVAEPQPGPLGPGPEPSREPEPVPQSATEPALGFRRRPSGSSVLFHPRCGIGWERKFCRS